MPGENPATAAAREVAEETGWDVLDPQLVRSLWRCPERSDHLGHLVIARAGQQRGEADPDEVVRLDWFPPDELRVQKTNRSGS